MPKHMVLIDPTIATRPDVLDLVADGKHRAVLAHLLALVFITDRETNGFLHRGVLKLVHARRTDVNALVGAGLWVPHGDGWMITDWVDNQKFRPRVPVGKLVRGTVFKRDGFACVLCGASERLSIDHIKPWSRGGTNAMDNLQTLCLSCNSTKRDTY
jgi:hypothetical protein